jgi:hypothetical protein
MGSGSRPRAASPARRAVIAVTAARRARHADAATERSCGGNNDKNEQAGPYLEGRGAWGAHVPGRASMEERGARARIAGEGTGGPSELRRCESVGGPSSMEWRDGGGFGGERGFRRRAGSVEALMAATPWRGERCFRGAKGA